MTIIEICLILITIILVVRSLIELVIILVTTKKAFQIINKSKEAVNNLKEVSQLVRNETKNITEMVNKTSHDFQDKIDTFKGVIDKIIKNLSLLNSVLVGVISTINFFSKPDDHKK